MKHLANTTFVGGEVTPRLLGRSDIERFTLSAERVENLMIRPQGPLSRRRGSQYIGSGISSLSELVSYAPRRETAEVLAFDHQKIMVVTQPIPSYTNPATLPTVQYDDDTVRSGAKFGFLGQDGTTYYQSLHITSGGFSLAPINTYTGVIEFSRGLFASVPDVRLDRVFVDDSDPLVEDPNYPLPSGLYLLSNLYHTDLAGALIATEVAVKTFLTQDTLTCVSTNGTLAGTLFNEYTDTLLFEDVSNRSASTPNTWVGSGHLATYTLPTLTVRRSRARFTLPTTQMVTGASYRINYTQRHTPLSGPVVDTNLSHTFTWNGSSTTTEPFQLPNPVGMGSVTIINPIWV